MSFTLIEKHVGAGGSARGVLVSRFGKKSILNIRVSPTVAKDAGLILGSRYDAFLGSGSDQGWIAVKSTESATGRKIGRPTKAHRSVLLRLPVSQLGADLPTKSFSPEHRIQDGMLIIDIRPLIPAAEQRAAA